jgi:hypothetical protein
MSEIKSSKNNEKENISKEGQKPIETLKDDIKKENISDIKIKNQSIQNNTNSLSKSFNSFKNENKEKDTKKEEIKILVYDDNQDIKDANVINNKKKERLIKKANNEPDLKLYNKYQFHDTIKKIKNKSLEKKMKDIYNSDKKDYNNNNINNKFMNRLKKIESQFEKISDYKLNKLKKNEEKKNIINDNNNQDEQNLLNFNFNLKKYSNNSENKYQEIKNLYNSVNKFNFSLKNNKYWKDDNDNSPLKKRIKENEINNYIKTFQKAKELKDIYKNYRIKQKNKNLIQVINNSKNFKNILDNIGKFEENKLDNKFNLFKNSFSYKDLNINSRYNKYRNKINIGLFKSTSLEKSSKLKNMMNDVYSEINSINNKTSKNYLNNKIMDIKAKIKCDNLVHKSNNYQTIDQNIFKNRNKLYKSNDLNFDDILKQCSKGNLKKYIKN